MKLFEIKNSGIKGQDETGKTVAFTYFDLAKMCLNKSPREGFTVQEMKARLRVMDVMEKGKSSGFALLEDADAEKLRQCVEGFLWGAMDKGVVEFVDYACALQPHNEKEKIKKLETAGN